MVGSISSTYVMPPVQQVVSDYIRTSIEGDKVVYTRHVHEGNGAVSTHTVQELGYVTYDRQGLKKPTPSPGQIYDIKA